MSKKHPRAKWVLPTTVNPSTSTCWAVPVPDDPFHKAAFLGALQTLASAVFWQDDPDHTAKDAAAVWRNIADNLELCPVIQFRNPDPCTLQFSDDGGSTWTTIYSDEECENANPQQPGAQTQPNAGDCTTFRAVLNGNNQWYIPFSLEDGDTVEILSADGIWTDGSSEFCPDGSNYSGGGCSGGGTNVTDPLPSANHMSMILVWPTTGALALPIGTPVTIPGGTGTVNAAIQANTAIISGNFGAISFHVQICKVGWTSIFDFTVSDGGFVPIIAQSIDCASYSSGAWRSVYNRQNNGDNISELRIYKVVSGSHTVRSVSGVFSGSGRITDEAYALGATYHPFTANFSPPSFGLTYTITDSGDFRFDMSDGGDAPTSNRNFALTQLVIQGTGTKPAGWP